MKKLNKSKIMSIVLYVMTALLLIYYVYSVYVAVDYIGTLVGNGEIKLGSSIGKVIQYMMSNTFEYLFYAIILGYIGSCFRTKTKKEI